MDRMQIREQDPQSEK